MSLLEAEPVVPVRTGWTLGFGAAWLGVWLAQLTVIQLLLPEQVAAGSANADLGAIARYGAVSAIAGVVALVAFPLAGALSDRTTSRFGRRRPWIVGGGVLFAAGLLLLGPQHAFAGIAIGWSIALAGFATVSAALTAMISDQVPVAQRGLVSAAISVPQAFGTILGLLLIELLALPQAGSYAVTAVLLLALLVPFVLTAPDEPASGRGRLTFSGLLASVWIDPRTHPDFAWTLTGRVLVNLGNALGTTLLLYFLADGLHDADAEADLIPLVLVYLVALVAASILCGRASDRTGRRLPFVVVAAALQGAAALLLALVPLYGTALVGAGLLGAGYGVFLSVDQALATQVLPDAASRGKDLGIMNIALAVPQAAGPLVGTGVIALFGGFGALFVAAAVFSALGAVAVGRVRSVR